MVFTGEYRLSTMMLGPDEQKLFVGKFSGDIEVWNVSDLT